MSSDIIDQPIYWSDSNTRTRACILKDIPSNIAEMPVLYKNDFGVEQGFSTWSFTKCQLCFQLSYISYVTINIFEGTSSSVSFCSTNRPEKKPKKIQFAIFFEFFETGTLD